MKIFSIYIIQVLLYNLNVKIIKFLVLIWLILFLAVPFKPALAQRNDSINFYLKDLKTGAKVTLKLGRGKLENYPYEFLKKDNAYKLKLGGKGAVNFSIVFKNSSLVFPKEGEILSSPLVVLNTSKKTLMFCVSPYDKNFWTIKNRNNNVYIVYNLYLKDNREIDFRIEEVDGVRGAIERYKNLYRTGEPRIKEGGTLYPDGSLTKLRNAGIYDFNLKFRIIDPLNENAITRIFESQNFNIQSFLLFNPFKYSVVTKDKVSLKDLYFSKDYVKKNFAIAISTSGVRDSDNKILKIIKEAEPTLRIEKIINELKEANNLILFIDEAHTIIGAGSALGVNADAANIFKSTLARGEVQIIGATTAAEHKMYIQEDEALARRFRVIDLKESSIEDTEKILLGVRPRLEKNYDVNISDEALETALELSPRYMHTLRLPDKPIAWLDTACVKVEINRPDDFVRPKDVIEVISQTTRVPLDMVYRDTTDRFSTMEEDLAKRVVGQKEAIYSVGKHLRLNKGPLKEKFERPDGVLLFLGPTGVGKTELAKALADEAGRQAFLVKYGSDGDERDRRGAITATMGMAPLDAVVVIDEADRLLNTATIFQPKKVDKGWINHFMDECKHKVIWIANESRSIESSVMRRFSYSLEFKKFTASQRASAWKMQLKGHSLANIIRPAMMSRLAREYETDAGGIASALIAAENIFSDHAPASSEVEETLGRLLSHHEKLSGVDRKKKKLNRLSPNYDVNALHTDFPVENLLSSLKARQQKIENGHRPFSANIMFWGVPGTGKTEFAKYIAQELGKELLIKRMSDLQSMWVGETEKQIAEAFEEAEKEGAVLFLDEADSLILDRKTAHRSWEASQTNEVLTQMENFKGVCICCTNLLDNLDEAALRRFTWKIKFLPLTTDGKEKLFRKYFQPKGRLSSEIRAALKEIRDLTPGDFKTVYLRQQYATEGESTLDSVKALKKEVSYKRTRSSSIGFGI